MRRRTNSVLSVFLTLLSLAWIYPVVMILLNALKTESAITTDGVFQLPTAETFAGLEHFKNAITSKGFLLSNSIISDLLVIQEKN